MATTWRDRFARRLGALDLPHLALALLFVAAALQVDGVYQSVLASIAASFIFLFCLNRWRDLQQYMEIRRFRHFFGEDAAANRMLFAYPEFSLNAKVKQALSAAGVHPQDICDKPHSPFRGRVPHRVDLPAAVAANDMQALIYVASLFGHICRIAPPISPDYRIVEQCDVSFMSFGLNSNDCTHLYVNRDDRLFFVEKDNTDEEVLVYTDASGRQTRVKSSDTLAYGLLLRYRPDPDDAPGRVWFLCAGLGAHGTTGAAWYLANKWRKLNRMVGRSDFLAIIRVQPGADHDSSLMSVRMRDNPREMRLRKHGPGLIAVSGCM